MYKIDNTDTELLISTSSNILLHRSSRKSLLIFLSILATVSFVLFFMYGVVQSPKERLLQQENAIYRAQLEKLNIRIDSMSKSLILAS